MLFYTLNGSITVLYLNTEAGPLTLRRPPDLGDYNYCFTKWPHAGLPGHTSNPDQELLGVRVLVSLDNAKSLLSDCSNYKSTKHWKRPLPRPPSGTLVLRRWYSVQFELFVSLIYGNGLLLVELIAFPWLWNFK